MPGCLSVPYNARNPHLKKRHTEDLSEVKSFLIISFPSSVDVSQQKFSISATSLCCFGPGHRKKVGGLIAVRAGTFTRSGNTKLALA